MTRRAFYSFEYKPDNWRASQVRNMGVVEGNRAAEDNDWEQITRGGDAAIQRWIDGQLDGKSVAIVLIGQTTANRKWINYEIKKAWEARKGVLGIYIHKLKDKEGNQSIKGENPFNYVSVGGRSMFLNQSLSSIVKTYDPGEEMPLAHLFKINDLTYPTSDDVYAYIRDNLAKWIETAIDIRNKYA